MLQRRAGNHAVRRLIPVQRQIGPDGNGRIVVDSTGRTLYRAETTGLDDAGPLYGLSPLAAGADVRDVGSTDPAYHIARERVAFGHGTELDKYSRKKMNSTTRCWLVLYGPLHSTLARSVSKWIRVKGLLPPGSLRVIPNGTYERICARYAGTCPSLERELWEAATPTDHPQVLPPGSVLPELVLEKQPEEDIGDEMLPARREVTQAQELGIHLGHLMNDLGPGDVLHWGACQQPDGKRIESTDSFVILDPALSAEVYPPTAAELNHEAAHQEKEQRRREGQTKRKKVDSSDSAPGEVAPKVVKLTQQDSPAPRTDWAKSALSLDLRNELLNTFKSSDDLDEQVARLDQLMIDRNLDPAIKRGTLLRFLFDMGHKGTPKD